MPDTPRDFLPSVQAVIADFLPIIRRVAGSQPYAIAVSGSLGKGTWDARSDVDFRLFTQDPLPSHSARPGLWDEFRAAENAWKEKGVTVDGIWPRSVGEVNAALDAWTGGKGQPSPLLWTIWGYHILPDIYHQAIVEDPYGIIAAWKERLSVYPQPMKQALLKKYLASLRYWREDYHYAHKVERGDAVFTAGMTSKLVHEILQILFALNQTYFVGDGSNLNYARGFAILPANFAARVETILYPTQPGAQLNQYRELCALIDEVLALAPEE